ncbi:MAG: CaiB/BaiF CoA transferase family protein [Myxococcota bacterium]
MSDRAIESSRPLSDLRVVEVAHYVAVPAAGALLADLGAEVIKVEQPPRGELLRRTRLKYAGYATEFDESPVFQMENRGKRSIVLDLTRDVERDALMRIVDRADVVITNLLPARRRKYGLDHESLLARRPELVVGAISGYGLGGEEADRPAFDYAAYHARSGMMDAMRDEGLPPSLLRPGVGDHAAGVNLVCGILTALRSRERTGRGAYVDVSLLQTGLHILGNDVANTLVSREPVRRHDRRTAMNPLWNSYPVAEDRWILLVMIDPRPYWPRLCRAIGREELVHDSRFEDDFARAANAAALIAILESVFAERSLEEWGERLDAEGLIWAPVKRVDEAIEDAQARELGYLPEIEHEDVGRFRTVAPPFRIQGADLTPTSAAPALDADGEDVLREAGLDAEQIAAVRGDR